MEWGSNGRLLASPFCSANPNFGRILAGVFPEDWQHLMPPKPAADVPSKRNICTATFEVIPDYIHQVISEGGNDNFLVLVLDENKNYYIQLRADKVAGKLILEAVSNNYLMTDMQLSDEQIDILRQQGFKLPDTPEENFRMAFPNDPAVVDQVVRSIKKLAAEVYGLVNVERIRMEVVLVLE